ncbi:hypothetical protein [Lactobacillus equicursoris]|nr:hypothetical protein [Lactobacillus equicursoris]
MKSKVNRQALGLGGFCLGRWLAGGCPLLVVGCRLQSMSTDLDLGENRP